MHEIVKYHNDMNTVNFQGFNAVELNLLLSICAKIRDEGTKTVTYDFDQLRDLSNYKFHGTDRFIKDLRATYRKLIHLTFCIGTETDFIEFVLFTKYQVSAERQEVTISVNDEFKYILNELTSNFTRFELTEFVNLQSKYAKNLYRLLKQYRTTGKAYFTIDDFRAKLDIPKSYAMREINRQVLAPIKKELSPLFDEFSIEKIKNLRRRGHPVTHINFYFAPQKALPGPQNESLERLREVYLPDFSLEEVKILLHHGSQEDLKRASKQYDNYKQDAKKPIGNKMGFMVSTVQKIAEYSNSGLDNNISQDMIDLTKDLFKMT